MTDPVEHVALVYLVALVSAFAVMATGRRVRVARWLPGGGARPAVPTSDLAARPTPDLAVSELGYLARGPRRAVDAALAHLVTSGAARVSRDRRLTAVAGTPPPTDPRAEWWWSPHRDRTTRSSPRRAGCSR